MIPLLRPFEKIWGGESCQPMVFSIGKSELESSLRSKISSSFFSFGTRGLRGSVQDGEISVFWNTPGFGNSWRPVFHGSISGDDRESRIEGKISTFRRTQVFYGIWFGLLAIFTLVLLPTGIGSVVTLGMMAFGTGAAALGQYLSRGEKEKILSALSGVHSSSTLQPDGTTQIPGRGMKIVAVVLVIFGVGNLIGSIAALGKGGITVTVASEFSSGMLALLVAWGILKKKRYAWILGFVLIATAAIYFPVSVFRSLPAQNGTDQIVLLMFGTLGALAVAIYWAVLWRAQRSYFYAGPRIVTARAVFPSL
ncbi:MAG: hypothetical protein JWM32_2683 [Verrucomicrobia bacterium]|nr:hypothetical protein [Verrucomicrobiota bacterium]